MKTLVEFRSNAFPAYEGEEETINPGVYGQRLAEFLVSGLKAKGFEPLQPIAEDWGWIVPIRNKEFRMWIGCGTQGQRGDFLCFIEPHRPLKRKYLIFGKVDTTAKISALREAIHELLVGHPEVRDIRWWTYQEFTQPGTVGS
jgi:hypothetical protein